MKHTDDAKGIQDYRSDEEMKNLTSSIYDFEKLRQGNYLYVDKTDFIWKLLANPGESYFLSRPRRFGKSLLVSTLKALFQGRRELFKGLAIDAEEYDWKAYPVIHLDFGSCMASTVEELGVFLECRLAECAAAHKLTLKGPTPQEQFIELILKLGSQVVILVDEYDKPILGNIDNPHVQEILSLLKGFYSVIKTYEGFIRFAFITGVSKFAHVSLFSDLNNLTDITLNTDYAGMLGFTEAEIRKYFADRIPLAAAAGKQSKEELMQTLLAWYDGYRFSKADLHVCNPVSISSFFSQGYDFTNFWDSTGTPTFLLKVAREKAYDYEAALSRFYSESIFSAYELDKLDVTGLLWQTGYLTIKETRKGYSGLQYRLGFPDREVAETFSMRLLDFYGNVEKGVGETLIDSFVEAIAADDLEGFMKLFKSFLAGISYDMHLPYEKYYQTIFFIVFKLLGIRIEAESCTNEGRIDAYIRTEKRVYVFEFKLNKTTAKAVAQIKNRHYYEKFQSCGLPIVMVGVNFNSKKGRIDNWAETTLALG